MVKLTAFKPFSSAADSLEQINSISEAGLTDDLKNFLTVNLPKVRARGGVGGSSTPGGGSPAQASMRTFMGGVTAWGG